MRQTGFLEPVITPDQFVLGDLRIGAVEPVLEEDSDWNEWDLYDDIQTKTFDTRNCTAFNTAQSISKLLYRKYNIVFKPSPRWIGIIAGTNWERGGNDPHAVCEAIRKNGLIPDDMLPWSDDIKTPEEYFSFKGADEAKCREEGKKWLELYEFRHDWVLTGANTLPEKLNNMKVALKYSPLGTAVYAWAQNQTGLYERRGPDTHWTEIRAFQNNNALVDDSYPPYDKVLTEDFNFTYVKRYVINKKVPVTPERAKTILQVLWSFIKGGIAWIFPDWLEEYTTVPARVIPPEPVKPVKTPQQWLKEAVNAAIGHELSEEAPEELACAEVVSKLLQIVYPDFPKFLHTAALFSHLKLDKRFKGTLEIGQWQIIISPTGYGNFDHGHVGVIGEKGLIYSNNSFNGRFEQNFTLGEWVDYYRVKGNFPIYVFDLV